MTDARKDAGQKEKRALEDEMAGRDHRYSEHEFGHSLGGTGRPGVLQSMGSQRVGHGWATEQQQQNDPCC